MMARQSQLVKRLHAHQQSQCRIQSSRYAHHGRLGMGMRQPLRQTGDLDGKYLFATLVQHRTLRHERMRVEHAGQLQLSHIDIFRANAHSCLWSYLRPASGKGGIHTPFDTEPLHVNLANDHLRLKRKPLAGSQQGAVLVNQSIACKDHIRRRFSEAARTEHVTRYAPGRLLGDERTQIGMFAHSFVIGRKIEDDFRALQGQFGTGGDRRPKVFAQLDAEGGVHGVEKQ